MDQSRSKAQQELASIRDMVESIWVAIVLAFVLRAFVVEAFVIPTGSMAPRLLGEHFDLQCRACGRRYAFGWSGDAERGAFRYSGAPGAPARGSTAAPADARCPNCTYGGAEGSLLAGGDRVLVMKYLYRFRQPEPWDVVVFKNPQDNRQNYIKRLVGLPGETIEIVHGDVFVSRDPKGPFRIRRKTRKKTQDAMWQVIFDNDYRPREDCFPGHDPAGGPESIQHPFWAPADAKAADLWNLQAANGRRFEFAGAEPDAKAELLFKCHPNTFLPLYGYNPDLNLPRDAKWHEVLDWQMNVVSDLNLAVTYVPKAPDSRIVLTLTRWEHVFQAVVGADGTAQLRYRRETDPNDRREADPNGEPWADWGKADLGKTAPGRGCEVALSHADLRVSLWIDGKEVLRSRDRDERTAADDSGTYPLDYRSLKARVDDMAKENGRLRERMEEMERRDPALPGERLARLIRERLSGRRPQVRIAASGGPCELWHVRLLRDVHYTCPMFRDAPVGGPSGEFAREQGVQGGAAGWGTAGNAVTLRQYRENPDLDQYFVLGDNSPSSLDGRLWTSAAVTLRLYDWQIAAADVTWGPLLEPLLRQEAGGKASPARQVWELLPADLRADLQKLRPQGAAEDLPPELQERLLRELNGMLSKPGLYAAEAWTAAGVELPEKAEALARKAAAGTKLTEVEQQMLNRLALAAAMPGAIANPRRLYQLGTVPRYSLIGKAIFVYWPAGFRVPGLEALPILPNVGRMRLIR